MGLRVDIEERRDAGIVILRPAGRIDNISAEAFQTRLLAVADRADTAGCILDMSAVPYIASFGMRAIIAAARALGGRRLAIAAPGPVVSEVFKVARLAQVLPIFDTVAAAEATLSAPR